MVEGYNIQNILLNNPLVNGTAALAKYTTETVGAVINTISSGVVPKQPTPPTKLVMEPLPLWQLANAGGYYFRLAGVLGASAVALGAYGAHSKFPKDDKIELKEVFERANKYHFIHSLAMLGVPLCRWPKTSGTFFILGITMFSGTCYYLALTGDRSFNKITPLGGICFILGWLALAL